MKVKICGITREEDARLAAELGAWAIGFIFYPKSPRYLAPEKAGSIGLGLKVERVGVFVNPDLALLRETVAQAGLTRIQLHGEEDDALCASAPLPVLKALRIRSEAELAAAGSYPSAAGFLLDSQAPEGVWGGTGERADWVLAARFRRALPASTLMLLAGGLGPSNVRQALAAVRPDGVDVSSGVEASPGIKDAAKLRALFQAVSKGGSGGG